VADAVGGGVEDLVEGGGVVAGHQRACQDFCVSRLMF
jgi:hypothetical protein